MTQSLWVAIPAAVLLVAFILFAFRQGTKVPPSEYGGTNNQNDYPPGG
jgi:hypothetical protein